MRFRLFFCTGYSLHHASFSVIMEERKKEGDLMEIDEIKKSLEEMNIPYKEEMAAAQQLALINSFGYAALPLVADLTHMDNIDAEVGVVVKNADQDVDNGVYIFTVLRSGQAGFVVVKPGTISRAPLIRKVSGDITSAVTGIDMPPLMPFDMMEIAMHVIESTVMQNIMEACRIPKQYEDVFLRIYFPRFLADMGLYYTGAVTKEGKPMVYEELANMEPMAIWNAIQKGGSSDEGGAAADGDTGTEIGAAKGKPGKEEASETE